MEQNTLTHHGIKGQKWGVRRFQTKSGSLTAAGKKRYGKDDEAKSKDKSSNEAHEDYKKVRAKTTKQMSDAELRDAVNRLSMEKRYNELNPKKKSLGKKFIDDFIMPAARDIGKEYVKKYMKELAGKMEKTVKDKSETKTDDGDGG